MTRLIKIALSYCEFFPNIATLVRNFLRFIWIVVLICKDSILWIINLWSASRYPSIHSVQASFVIYIIIKFLPISGCKYLCTSPIWITHLWIIKCFIRVRVKVLECLSHFKEFITINSASLLVRFKVKLALLVIWISYGRSLINLFIFFKTASYLLYLH